MKKLKKQSREEMRVNLNVPFSEKDEAKRLGARWDPAARTWYVKNIENLTPFLQWIPGYFKKPYHISLNDWLNEAETINEPIKKQIKKKSKKPLIESSKPIRGANYVETICDCLPWIGCEKCRMVPV